MRAERNTVNEINLDSKFRAMISSRCLNLFRCEKQDLLNMVQIFVWPEFQLYTSLNGYSVAPLLVTCTVIWRFHTTSTWESVG